MKITQNQLRQMIKEELAHEAARRPPPMRTGRLRSGQGLGAPRPGRDLGPEVSWDDFAEFGMDQVGDAFVAAGGDPMLALQMLQMGAMAAAQEDEP
jgi:hypothetical protein